MTAFSVAVTLASSSRTSAPRSPAVRSMKWPFWLTSAPMASRASRCVSMRRRPILSPPGMGSSISRARASIGPIRVNEPRVR